MSQKEHDRRIDYIEFFVRDIEATKRFYSAAFAWKFEDYGPDYTSFNDGRISGGFTRDQGVTIGGALIVIYASSLSEVRERVINADGKIVGDLHRFPGGCRFYFTDPTGHRLAVWSETEN